VAYPKPQVFLDSNVLVSYLNQRPAARRLLADDVRSRYKFIANGIVIQELLLAIERSGVDARDLDRLLECITVEDMDSTAVRDFARHHRELRNWAAHSNDLLLLWTARQCDVLLTYDMDLVAVAQREAVNVATPEDFLKSQGFEV
jgi:predicted nucleic acid-binding protein